jgi:hypothetical protein
MGKGSHWPDSSKFAKVVIVKEVWLPVVGYEGLYEVSNLGNVMVSSSNPSKVTHFKGRNLRSTVTVYGYVQACLTKYGVEKSKRVHRLVAEAFLPNLDNKPYVNHIDANRLNNYVDNLEWCTNLENVRHSVKLNRHGRSHSGMDARKALQVREFYQQGTNTKQLADIFKCSRKIILSIIYNQTWKDNGNIVANAQRTLL